MLIKIISDWKLKSINWQPVEGKQNKLERAPGSILSNFIQNIRNRIQPTPEPVTQQPVHLILALDENTSKPKPPTTLTQPPETPTSNIINQIDTTNFAADVINLINALQLNTNGIQKIVERLELINDSVANIQDLVQSLVPLKKQKLVVDQVDQQTVDLKSEQ